MRKLYNMSQNRDAHMFEWLVGYGSRKSKLRSSWLEGKISMWCLKDSLFVGDNIFECL